MLVTGLGADAAVLIVLKVDRGCRFAVVPEVSGLHLCFFFVHIEFEVHEPGLSCVFDSGALRRYTLDFETVVLVGLLLLVVAMLDKVDEDVLRLEFFAVFEEALLDGGVFVLLEVNVVRPNVVFLFVVFAGTGRRLGHYLKFIYQ